MGLEGDATLFDRVEAGERKDLKAAGIGKHRAIPTHELMQTASRGDDALTRLQVQMERVGEDHLRSGAAQLLDADALHRGRGTHRHEAGRVHHTVGGMKTAHPSTGVGAALQQLKTEGSSRLTQSTME